MAKVNRGTASKVAPETASDASDVDTSNVEQANDAAAAAEFDAAADAARDPFFATFEVTAKLVENANAREKIGAAEAVFTVTRQRKGSYVASFAKAGEEPVIGKESRKPDVAVKYAIKALGLRDAEFMFDAFEAENAQAPMPEGAGDNAAPETWFYDDPSDPDAARLAEVVEEVNRADALMTGAAKDTRTAWRAFGHGYNVAKEIFASRGLSGEGEGDSDEVKASVKRGKAAWGTWLRTRFADSENAKAILESKNAAAQAGFFALAPEEVIDAANAGTASTFMRKAEEAVSEFGMAIAEAVLAQRRSEGSDDRTLTDAQAFAEAKAKLEARETAYSDAFAKWKEAAAKAAEKQKTPPAFADAKAKGPLVMVRWLFDIAGDDFGKSKLGRGIVKAWNDKLAEPSEEEKAERETSNAAAKIAKRFADMEVSDAARHLLNILVAHPAPDMVLEAVGDMLVDWQAEQVAKAEAEKAKAEAAAEAGA